MEIEKNENLALCPPVSALSDPSQQQTTYWKGGGCGNLVIPLNLDSECSVLSSIKEGRTIKHHTWKVLLLKLLKDAGLILSLWCWNQYCGRVSAGSLTFHAPRVASFGTRGPLAR
jgi:hypothetical protein